MDIVEVKIVIYYEWTCPICNHLQTERDFMYEDILYCDECYNCFKTKLKGDES